MVFAAGVGVGPIRWVPLDWASSMRCCFQAYNARKGGHTPELLSTHPLDNQRIARLEQLLPQARAEYRRARGRR